MGGDESLIRVQDLPPTLQVWQKERQESGGEEGGRESRDLAASLESYEREIILDALRRSGWVQSRAARLLGISERAMWYRVKKLDIPIPA